MQEIVWKTNTLSPDGDRSRHQAFEELKPPRYAAKIRSIKESFGDAR